MKLLAIDLSHQFLPSAFEHALSHLVDHELDLRVFDEHFRIGQFGAPTYAPSGMFKVIVYVYSQGIISSRNIATAGQENGTFMALSGGGNSHVTNDPDHRSDTSRQRPLVERPRSSIAWA
jgi:transposase